MMLLTLFGVARAQSELTVYEGTATQNVVPAYLFYFDDFTRIQHVIPADSLNAMTGGTINSLKYYTTSQNVPYTAVSSARVYLMEVDDTTMTGLESVENGEVVFEGYFDIVSEGEGGSLTIDFDTPFIYSGGNLLVGIDNTEDVGYKSIYFYGQTTDYISGWGGSSSTSLESVTGTGRSFIPQTTFTYTSGSGPVCDRPSALTVGSVDAHSASLTWEGGSGLYKVEYKKASDEDWTVALNNTTALTTTLTGLTQNTSYNVRVQSICSGDVSGYRTASFTTEIACPTPTDLSVAIVPGDGTKATFSWTETGSATQWQLCLNDDETNLITMTTNPFTYSHFTPEQTYSAKVRAYCDAVDQSSWSNTVTFTPTDAYLLTVNDGTNTNGYVPVYGYWADKYSKSQFIIPAEDLAAMAYGTINQLTFYSSNDAVSWGAAEFEVYVKEVGYTTFEAVEDWSTMELVKSAGSLSVSGNTMEVTLDNPYQYYGDNLMIGVLQTTSGTYSSVNWYGVTTEENTAIGGYETSKALSYQKFLPKTTFAFTPGEAPACPKPMGLVVNYTEGNTAVVSWNSTATAWNMKLNGTAVSGTITNPYTLTNLELGTEYSVEVQANCGGGELSEWAGPVTFTTDACMPEDKIMVNYELADSYGDGWNGNYILVVDENCSIVEALTISSGSSASGTIGICGSYAQFLWYMGSYPGEASWTFTDMDGNVLFEGTGSTSMATYDVLYTIDNNPLAAPSGIDVAEIGPHSAKLSWTENGTATAWQIMLGEDEDNIIEANSNPFVITGLNPETEYFAQVRSKSTAGTSMWTCVGVSFTTTEACPAPSNLTATGITYQSAHLSWTGFGESYDLRYMALDGSKGEVNNNSNRDSWYYYDNGTLSSSIGTGGSDVYWGIMLPAGMTNNTTLTKVSFYSAEGYDETITLSVYAGGTDAPSTLLYTEDIEPEAAEAFQEVTLATPVSYDCLSNLWIVLKQYGEYPAMGCTGPTDPNGRWISLDGEEWMDIADAGYDYTWLLRAYCEGEVVLPWINVTGINASEYDLTGLEAETLYNVQVRSNCGDDGTSDWASAQFTTGSMCDTPNELTVTDLAATSATLNWTSGLNNFNVKYREVPHGELYNSTDFDDSTMDGWTTIDADGDGYTWVLGSECGGIYLVEGGSLAGQGHNSSADLVVSGSYTNVTQAALTPDNYLVSPQVTLGGVISFWACGQDASYPAEHFGVAVSTTVNDDNTAFTTIQEWTMTAKGASGTTRSGNRATGNWYQFTADLSEYSGQGYVAIRHFDCTDQFMLDVDDILIEGQLPVIEWNTVTTTESTLAITGLTPETEYEWQVQGVNTSCTGGTTDWSDVVTFTTPEQTTITQTFDLNAGVNWVSFVVETDMTTLRTALVDALPGTEIMIKGPIQSCTYKNNRWSGQLKTLDLSNMYLIKVVNSAEITLEGMPIDAAALPVAINSGTNWIAYPLLQSMSVQNIFSGFAVNNDMVKGPVNSATYKNGRWSGQLKSLEPSKGYLYKSAATESRVFTFPTSAKKATPKASTKPINSFVPASAMKMNTSKTSKVNIFKSSKAKTTDLVSPNIKKVIKSIK